MAIMTSSDDTQNVLLKNRFSEYMTSACGVGLWILQLPTSYGLISDSSMLEVPYISSISRLVSKYTYQCLSHSLRPYNVQLKS
jgi:hypothetical protein